MKKFLIEESEKERILEMHKKATMRQYLSEGFKDPNNAQLVYSLNFKDANSLNKYMNSNFGQSPVISKNTDFNAYLPQLTNLIRIAHAFGMQLPTPQSPEAITNLATNIQKFRTQIANFNNIYPKIGVDMDNVLSYVLDPKATGKGGFWMTANPTDTSKYNYQIYLDWVNKNIRDNREANTVKTVN
jgi:hypothetical protein